jgi:hypothetical protein
MERNTEKLDLTPKRADTGFSIYWKSARRLRNENPTEFRGYAVPKAVFRVQ